MSPGAVTSATQVPTALNIIPDTVLNIIPDTALNIIPDIALNITLYILISDKACCLAVPLSYYKRKHNYIFLVAYFHACFQLIFYAFLSYLI